MRPLSAAFARFPVTIAVVTLSDTLSSLSPGSLMPYHSKWQDLPTEAINPATLGIDKMPVLDIIDLISGEDRRVVAAVHRERERIAHGVEIIVGALKKGGRLFLVGAGTSGRLGVVEAAEMPPTFGTPPKLVQAIMAGGQEAVFRAREGVEDNFEEGARSIARLRVTKRDVDHRRLGERHHAVRARRADRRRARRARASSSSRAGRAPSCRTSSI